MKISPELARKILADPNTTIHGRPAPVVADESGELLGGASSFQRKPMSTETNDIPETGKRTRPRPTVLPKKRDYKADLAEIQGRVDMALKLFGKCEGLPTLAEAAIEILEGK